MQVDAERTFHDVDNGGAKMKNFYVLLYFLMTSFFPFSSNSTNNKQHSAAIIEQSRPSFHQIEVKIELPIIEKNEDLKQILALCENHPWSLNQCQTQTLQDNKTTFTFKGKHLHL